MFGICIVQDCEVCGKCKKKAPVRRFCLFLMGCCFIDGDICAR